MMHTIRRQQLRRSALYRAALLHEKNTQVQLHQLPQGADEAAKPITAEPSIISKVGLSFLSTSRISSPR